MTETPPFDRTKCACKDCVSCCKRQPGPLIPGDFERIAAFLGMSHDDAKGFFWASPGSMVKNLMTGAVKRIGTITPRFIRRTKRCVFLTEDDKCSIHEVAPFGCAYFDWHMSAEKAMPRSLWLAEQNQDPAYQELRNELPYAQSYNPSPYRP